MLFGCFDYVFHSIQDELLSVLIALSFMDQFEPRFPGPSEFEKYCNISGINLFCSLQVVMFYHVLTAPLTFYYFFPMLQILSERK